jgi:aryl-alcohol dehydrogenase-like predicted oxidoreductase
MYQTRYGADWTYQVAEAFASFAAERGFNPVSLAVAWVGAHPANTPPNNGARNLDQLEGSLQALEIDMNAELYAKVSALSPEPPPATDRNEEGTASTFAVR